MATEEELMAAKMMGFWECPKCGKRLEGRDAGPDMVHGWPADTGRVVQEGDLGPDGKPVPPEDIGAGLWKFVNCADATDEEVAVYKAARAEIDRRNQEGA